MPKILVNFARRTDMKVVFGAGMLAGAFLTRVAQEYGVLTRPKTVQDAL